MTWIWLYGPPIDAALLGLKFRRLDYLARPFGRELARRLVEGSPGIDQRVDIIVPVPLHIGRRLRRGYDQAELIAAEVARRLGKPLRSVLARRRRTLAQSDRGRVERQVNLEGAFKTRRRIEGLRVLLVDDVMTTGATLEASTAALLEAGAAAVEAAVLARTPENREGESRAGDL